MVRFHRVYPTTSGFFLNVVARLFATPADTAVLPSCRKLMGGQHRSMCGRPSIGRRCFPGSATLLAVAVVTTGQRFGSAVPSPARESAARLPGYPEEGKPVSGKAMTSSRPPVRPHGMAGRLPTSTPAAGHYRCYAVSTAASGPVAKRRLSAAGSWPIASQPALNSRRKKPHPKIGRGLYGFRSQLERRPRLQPSASRCGARRARRFAALRAGRCHWPTRPAAAADGRRPTRLGPALPGRSGRAALPWRRPRWAALP